MEAELQQLPRKLEGQVETALADARVQRGKLTEKAREILSEWEQERRQMLNTANREALQQILQSHKARGLLLLASSATGSQRTDSRGAFTVPRGTGYVWAAKRHDREDLYWLRQVKADGNGKMLLCNSNVSSQDEDGWFAEIELE